MAKKKSKLPAARPDKSGQQLARKPGTFLPGAEWKGNAAGRPKGVRNKLCRAYIEDLQDVWAEHGKPALLKIAKRNPVAFVKAVGSLVPQEFDLGDRTQSTFLRVWEALSSGKLAPLEESEDG